MDAGMGVSLPLGCSARDARDPLQRCLGDGLERLPVRFEAGLQVPPGIPGRMVHDPDLLSQLVQMIGYVLDGDLTVLRLWGLPTADVRFPTPYATDGHHGMGQCTDLTIVGCLGGADDDDGNGSGSGDKLIPGLLDAIVNVAGTVLHPSLQCLPGAR